jgi:hypothetical protein
MPLCESEEAVPLYGRETGTHLVVEAGFIENQSRERKANDHTAWPV